MRLVSLPKAVARIVAGACVVACCVVAQPGDAQAPTATELYRRALVVMNDLPQPAFITYRLDGTMQGVPIHLSTQGCGALAIPPQQHWTLQTSTHDDKTIMLDTESGRRYEVPLDPSWMGTYRRLRHPVLFTRFPCPRESASPAPAPIEPSPGSPALRVIGTVVALGPGIYAVEDRGAATCPNGDPGHALHLTSRTHDPRQQLSDVVIELKSLRFCMVRFGLHRNAGLAYDATFEQHFADVGGYWVQTDGRIEATERLLGISSAHGLWQYRYLDMRFPESIPAEAFAPIPPALSFDPGPYLRAQRLVDIGGRRLNLSCTGSGSPAVVLEAGGGADMLDWRIVQPLVAKRTRVCSYDRAGAGFSDPGPLPRDAGAIADDLHALVTRAGITKPFVLVGYSNGELFSRVYADRYLGDLAGLVLVEPALEGDQEARVHAAAPELARDAARQTATAKACAAATEHGSLQPKSDAGRDCSPPVDPDFPQALNAVIAQQSRRPGWWATFVSENVDALHATTLGQLRTEQRSYGALPLAVVTVKDAFPSGSVSPAEAADVRDIVEDARARLPTYSSRGSRIELDACSHADVVTRCAPDVASAIASVVDQARAGARP